jgi:hypothetical protein
VSFVALLRLYYLRDYPDANIQAFADDVGGDTGNKRVKATNSMPPHSRRFVD